MPPGPGYRYNHAHTPQTKGRIERLWETLQDGLFNEMKLFGIDSIEKANKFLPGFIERFNKRFSVKPKDPEHAFMKSPEKKGLLLALTIRHNRKVGTDSMISFQGKKYQIRNKSGKPIFL